VWVIHSTSGRILNNNHPKQQTWRRSTEMTIRACLLRRKWGGELIYNPIRSHLNKKHYFREAKHKEPPKRHIANIYKYIFSTFYWRCFFSVAPTPKAPLYFSREKHWARRIPRLFSMCLVNNTKNGVSRREIWAKGLCVNIFDALRAPCTSNCVCTWMDLFLFFWGKLLPVSTQQHFYCWANRLPEFFFVSGALDKQNCTTIENVSGRRNREETKNVTYFSNNKKRTRPN